MKQPLTEQIHEVASLLMLLQVKIVFAESCTGGLISASLARSPGISQVHCGSAVVYRPETKSEWLGVAAPMLNEPGPVSEPVARAMAAGVLERTPEADMAVSITGHLGPNAPDTQDGLVYVGIAIRDKTCRVTEHRLEKFLCENDHLPYPGETEREQRQWLAVTLVFREIATVLRDEYLSF
jgi:nicotinamide-nucleotide amidase